MADPVYPGYDPNRMNTTVVTVITTPNLGHEPARVTCPSCHNHIVTSVTYESNNKTHINALLLCLLCGCIPGFIPYCCNSCQTAVHTCPVCRQNVGTHDN